jgi:hypothetical protein
LLLKESNPFVKRKIKEPKVEKTEMINHVPIVKEAEENIPEDKTQIISM